MSTFTIRSTGDDVWVHLKLEMVAGMRAEAQAEQITIRVPPQSMEQWQRIARAFDDKFDIIPFEWSKEHEEV